MPYLPLVGYPMLFIVSISNRQYTGWKDDNMVFRSVVLHLVSWTVALGMYYGYKFGTL